MKNNKLIIIVFLISWISSHAQHDSLPINEFRDTILVEPNRLPEFGSSHNSNHLDKALLQNYSSKPLSSVLELESSFFVKNYGPSNISTLSGRGGSSNHTSVLWEGFNIQSIMLGLVDISLLPTVFVDYIDIQYGGESALFGNSSIGGNIHMGTESKYNKGWKFWGNMNIGSFEKYGQQFKLSFSNKWYACSIRSFYNSAKNNFPFRDINAFSTPKPIKDQSNALVEQFGLLHEQFFKIKLHQFGLKIWYQNSYRQIPPTLLININSDLQKDESIRIISQWKYVIKNQIWQIRTGLFMESLLFQNDNINALSKVLSSITKIDHKWYINDYHLLNIGLNYNFNTAISNSYDHIPQQHRATLFAAYKISTKNNTWVNSFRFREELIDGQFISPAISIGSVWKFFKELRLKLQLSHNYRLPTFNDLYWDVVGNPNLKPEYSWNSELGIDLPFNLKNTIITANITGYCNLINDWILWTPDLNGYWRPNNIDQVWARGFESNFLLETKWKKFHVKFGLKYAYTVSTRTKGQNTENIGKQLTYTPIHNANTHIQIRFAKTTLLYQHSFTSERFINNLNSESLPFFQVGHLRLSHQFILKGMKAIIYCQINNLFGENYQVVSNRPMPWQQFEFGLNIGLSQ
ncbi:MAG: TonB-dependent receptor [Saprospiraceae bacterium]|nr:TonB-dependent receptor [Saprospiraceae bacterium]